MLRTHSAHSRYTSSFFSWLQWLLLSMLAYCLRDRCAPVSLSVVAQLPGMLAYKEL